MTTKPVDEEVHSCDKRSTSKKSRKKAANSNQVSMCITDCKYKVVREAARARGWKLVDEDPDFGTRKCHVYWVDLSVIAERMQQLQRWQRINHFPGMSNVARKGRLAQNLDRMRRSFPQEFGFYPRTWVLPAEWGGFKAEFDPNGKSARTFIIKPDSGCQGRGIFLTQDLQRVASLESQVAQVYVRRPLLVGGFKFDLRIYVLVTSVIPLRVYAFRDGLARFCTQEYVRPANDNLDERCMHLTNYAVNKGSDNFVAYEGADQEHLGSKRSLQWLLEWVASHRGRKRAEALWRKIGDACVKTLVSILPTLHREYLNTFGPDGGAVTGRNVICESEPSLSRAEGTVGSVLPEGRENPCRQAVDGSSTAGGTARSVLPEGRENPCRQAVDGSSTGQDYRSTSGTEQNSSISSLHHDVATEFSGVKGLVENQVAPGDLCSNLPGGTVDGENVGERDRGRGVVGGSRCVEILGFDFMVDEALKPWLIEVNHLPSFATDSPLDSRIKSRIVSAALSVLRTKADDKKCYRESTKRDAQNRLCNPKGKAPGCLARELERREAEAIVSKMRRKVEAIYGRFAPQKLGKVAGLLARYAGSEDKLLRLARRKYVDAARKKGELGVAQLCRRIGGVECSAPSHGSGAAGTELRPGVDEIGSSSASQRRPEHYASAEISADTERIACCEDRFGRSLPNPRRPITTNVIGNTPSWASQHNPLDLLREASILEGWERLHPPADVRHGALRPSSPPQAIDGEGKKSKEGQTWASRVTEGGGGLHEGAKGGRVDLGSTSAGAEDTKGGASCRRNRRKPMTVEAMIQQAFEDDRKMTMRLNYPLQQRRGGLMDPQPTATRPLLAQTAASSAKNQADAAVRGPDQRKKAQRLMEGYSSESQRSTSAPTWGDQEAKFQLPVSLRVAMARAKEWRRRLDEGNARRASRPVAIKVPKNDNA